MRTATVDEVQDHLRELLDRVELGEEVLIVRAGKPVGRLVPAPLPSGIPIPGRGKGKLVIHCDDATRTSRNDEHRRKRRVTIVKDTSVLAINERLATRIRREGKKSNSKYAKKYVGIVSGEIVIIADSLDEVASRLRKIETDSTKCYIVDVAADYDRTYEV